MPASIRRFRVLKLALAASLLFILTVLLLSACSSEDPKVTPSPGAPTTTAAPLMSPHTQGDRLARELAYADDNQALWLVSADAKQRRQLLAPGECGTPSEIVWSPTGDRLLCIGLPGSPTQGDPGRSLVLLTAQGEVLKRFDGVWPSTATTAWSASATYFVFASQSDARGDAARLYTVADRDGSVRQQFVARGVAVWSSEEERLAYASDGKIKIHSVADGSERIYDVEATAVLGWVLDRMALVISRGDAQRPANYLLRLQDLSVKALPPFYQYWPDPQGEYIAFLGSFHPDGFELHLLNLRTLSLTELDDSRIGYPSEGIPLTNVAFAPDGKLLYWLKVWNGNNGLYRADVASAAVTELGATPGYIVRFSPDRRMVATLTPRQGGAILTTSRTDGSNLIEIGLVFNAFAWRPQ